MSKAAGGRKFWQVHKRKTRAYSYTKPNADTDAGVGKKHGSKYATKKAKR